MRVDVFSVAVEMQQNGYDSYLGDVVMRFSGFRVLIRVSNFDGETS